MIIWGSRTTILTLAMLNFVCGNCSNPAAHAVKRRLTKFTLFFIPLFPIASSYFTQCTFCGATTRVTKEQSVQMVAQAGGEQPQMQQPQQQAPQQPQGTGNPYASNNQQAQQSAAQQQPAGGGFPQQQAGGGFPQQQAQPDPRQAGYGYPQQQPQQPPAGNNPYGQGNPYGQNPYGQQQ